MSVGVSRSTPNDGARRAVGTRAYTHIGRGVRRLFWADEKCSHDLDDLRGS